MVFFSSLLINSNKCQDYSTYHVLFHSVGGAIGKTTQKAGHAALISWMCEEELHMGK